MDERIAAPEPSEAVLPDPEQVPMPAWVTPVLSLAALALVPWTLWLTFSLPMQRVAHNYDIAWVGFDIALLAAFAANSWAAYRGSHWLVPLAAALGTMLICDAWFDVMTSHGGDERLESLLSAAFVELPLGDDLRSTSSTTPNSSGRRPSCATRRRCGGSAGAS